MHFKHIFKKSRVKRNLPLTNRRQFNVIIDHDITEMVKRLAVHLAVKQSTVAEHALQVGCIAMENVIDDPERREKLRQHLIEDHQLSDGAIETDDTLHIVDTHYASDVIQLANILTRHFTNLQRLTLRAKQGDASSDDVDECTDHLVASALALAVRVTRYPLDEEQPSPGEVGRLMPLVRPPRQRPRKKASPFSDILNGLFHSHSNSED